jgi:hypothetical protein
MQKLLKQLPVAGAVLMLWSGLAVADTETLDISGVASCDAPGAVCNTIIDIDLGAGSVLTGIGWDVTISTNSPSWFSEATISYGPDNGDPTFFSINPGLGDDTSGIRFFSSGGIFDLLTGLGQTYPLDNGILRLEFSENFVDFNGSPDAFYVDPSLLTFQFDPAVDSDGDGVPDPDDFCPETAIPEAGVPGRKLGVNRWALMDDDFDFDTKDPKGKGPERAYSTADTAGCSCEQIIAALELGRGHTKFGCSISAMDDWVLLMNP